MKVSFCVPIMNRFEDLKSTLPHNLSLIKRFNGEVELVVHCFDVDDIVEKWVIENFSGELQSGLLRFKKLKKLKHWHFCWAKNSFSNEELGDYYSSLDGDNFLDITEVEKILELVSSNSKLLIHHFSGSWGDGTSGRITLPSDIYKKLGYDNKLFPRQFDEISLMMAALNVYRDIFFVSCKGVYIEDKSNFFKEFILKNSISINRIEVDFEQKVAPLQPRGQGYVEKDEKLTHYQEMNGLYSMAKFSSRPEIQKFFENKLKQKQDDYFNSGKLLIPLDLLFECDGALGSSDELTLYSVIKDDHVFLKSWYEHYTLLGVKRFIIVDDGSAPSLKDSLNYENVFIFTPLVGDFKYFKIYWLRYLMKLFQRVGSWAITVDSDEFIDLSGFSRSKIDSFLSVLPKTQNFVPGVMIDMAPESSSIKNENNFFNEMCYSLFKEKEGPVEYLSNSSIKWAFGEYWKVAYAFDIRYRYFNTFDCLRKFPIIRVVQNFSMNQGFHDLKHHGTSLSHDSIFNGISPVVPIKHYKLLKLFSSEISNNEKGKSKDQYFARTKLNIERLHKFSDAFLFKFWPYSPYKKKYNPKEVSEFLNLGRRF